MHISLRIAFIANDDLIMIRIGEKRREEKRRKNMVDVI